MDDDSDSYVAQLKDVFVSCDTTGSGCLNASELALLCKKLHLHNQTDILVNEVLQKTGGIEVKFEDFKNCFIALLSRSAVSEDKETFESSSPQEVADREVSPKFILGRKKYGRRSRPASSVEGDGQLSPPCSDPDSSDASSPPSCTTPKSNQKPEGIPGKRPVSPSYPQQPPTKSGRMADLMIDKDAVMESQHQNSSCDSDCNSYSDNNLVDYLRQTWKKLEIGCDGFLTAEELALVCEHIGMDMTEEVICQLFEKLDCDQDGRISFNEFVQGLFQHGEPQNWDSVSSPSKPSQQLFKEPSRDEQISTLSVSGLFSCLDEESKGYAEGCSVVALWKELLEVPCPSQLLEDLGYSPNQAINLSDLSNALEEEILSCLRTPLAQLAFATFQNELGYLRQSVEQSRTERGKLRESVEEANSRAALLAQEVDDNHARLESALRDKLLLAEKKYQEQVRELAEDLQQERDSLAQQSSQLKQQLHSEIQAIREEEAQLKARLQDLEQDNGRLESELQEATERCRESEKQRETLQKELSGVSALKQRLADLESHQGEIEERQHRSLILELDNYKRINQELQDRIDELSLEVESLQQAAAAADSGGSSVSRTHSWLSDYKKAALVGFKRRGSDSSSEDNSDDECPTIGKMRRTFPKNIAREDTSLEAEIIEDKGPSTAQAKMQKKPKCHHPASFDILLRNLFVDRERLLTQLCTVEELKQKAELSNMHLRNKCKILSKIAYDATKTAVA